MNINKIIHHFKNKPIRYVNEKVITNHTLETKEWFEQIQKYNQEFEHKSNIYYGHQNK